jgi:hypothetical protein
MADASAIPADSSTPVAASDPRLSQRFPAALRARTKTLIEKGGYISFGDHFMPPDVGFAAFTRYREELNRIVFETKVQGVQR